MACCSPLGCKDLDMTKTEQQKVGLSIHSKVGYWVIFKNGKVFALL